MHNTSSVPDDIYLTDWLQGLDQAKTVLVRETGATPDYTPESLSRFWGLVRNRCQQRPRFSDPLENEPQTIPEWTKREGLKRIRSAVTTQTLELMGCLARYYGECLQRATPQAQWRIWRWGVKGRAVHGEGQVGLYIPGPGELETIGDPVFPIHDIDVMVMRILGTDQPHESTDFMAMYHSRVQALQEQAVKLATDK